HYTSVAPACACDDPVLQAPTLPLFELEDPNATVVAQYYVLRVAFLMHYLLEVNLRVPVAQQLNVPVRGQAAVTDTVLQLSLSCSSVDSSPFGAYDVLVMGLDYIVQLLWR